MDQQIQPDFKMRSSELSRHWLAALALCLVLSVSAFPETLKEYKEKVSHLRADFGRLLEPEDDMTGEDLARFEKEVLEEVDQFTSEQNGVEFAGGEVEADNSWLRERISEYRPDDSTYRERDRVFRTVYERLGAIEGKLEEMVGATEAGGPKDETRKKLNEILAREEYRGPTENTEDSIAAKIIRWIQEVIQWLFPPREVTPPKIQGLGTLGYVLQIVIYGAVIAIVGFLIYKFVPYIARRRKRERGSASERIVLGEKIAAGATPDELFSEAERLAMEGRLREALRKGYIATLFGLGEKKAIGLARHKTNRDYLREIRGGSELHGLVTGLTASYERHWYGAEEADESEWKEFKGACAKAVDSRAN